MSHKREDLVKLSAKELRQLLRSAEPKCRGFFASHATKDECIEILSGQIDVASAISKFEEKRHGGVPAPNDIKPDAPKSDKKADLQAEIEKILLSVEPLSPVGVKGIRDGLAAAKASASALIEAEKELKKAREIMLPSKSVEFDKNAKTVKILNESFPMVDSNSKMVPVVDEHYEFGAWRSASVCGAVEFSQSATDLIKAVIADHRVQLVGPPAVGKTSVIEQLAAVLKWPLTRFNFNQDLTVHDFVGGFEAVTTDDGKGGKVGVTKWQYGPLPQAMREGHILILDEIDHAPAECSSIIHSVLEPKGKLVLTANGGEVIEPHKKFRIVATSNTAGFGDSSGIHPNAKVQDAALLSRFNIVFHVDWMKLEDEVKLLRKTGGVNGDEAAAIAKIAKGSRQLYSEGQIQYPITLRQTLSWATTTKVYGLSTAFALTVLGKLPKHDAGVVGEYAQRELGEKLDEVVKAESGNESEA